MQNKINKKGVTQVISIVLLISLALVLIGIFWFSFKNIIQLSPETTICKDLEFKSPISIIKSCNLNQNETQILIKREIDNLEINSINFIFSNGAIFQLKQESKCLDLKEANSKYGQKCSIPNQREQKEYLFDLTGETPPTQIGIEIETKKITCLIDVKEIKNNC
ncbi:hypothetical protein HN832_00600 [archaeon]|jgi:hypothetical protein|nr:hypothetical protein [archaeon]MBT4373879.1 hypothetical protein [archaeon]MBT4532401.1 hypothetical protein [archaeon]MBT7001782.1 hypothetical protein [archaeon]MBT7281893.1 hypothetical protein [archaeon]